MSAAQGMGRQVEAALRRLLKSIGRSDPGVSETPARWLKAFAELTAGYAESPAAILSKRFDVRYDEMVVVRGVKFWSLCEHHLLPFEGEVALGYIPKDRVVGLSKLPRLVQCFARRLQVQERMTQEIADAIQVNLDPAGVGVLVQARHSCMAMRGVRCPGTMSTSALYGVLRSNPSAREEFLKLAGA